jgi:N-acetylated-alpha-linked acidic dipeptidase
VNARAWKAERGIAALVLGGAIALAPSAGGVRADAPATPRGFTPAQAAGEAAAERIVEASPSESVAMRYELGLASYVHRMGTPGDYKTAVYVRDVLAKAGWDAKLVTYVVPIAWPTEQRITLLTPHPHPLDLYERAIPSDPYSRDHAAIGIPYSGYSADGDVTGPVVYANYARPEDLAALEKAGVHVRGAIVVARSGKGSLTGKAFAAAERGALATLVFSDPMDGGYFKGDTYPNGPWRPTSAATRNTMTFTNPPGDPTAIGIPVPGAPHKPFSAMKVPSIPEMPITGDVAAQLIAAMGGPVAPDDWHGGFPLSLHLGGTTRAHVVLKTKRFFGPIWDTIATLPGSDPSQMVVVGGHRDAWTYGAVDPISGTVDLLQLGEALGKAARAGWKPRRSIVIGSWDGEELNLFGSETWVEQHEDELRRGCVAYMNTDEVAFGPELYVAGTPDLAGALRAAADAVRAPDGTSLAAYWKAQDPKQTVFEAGGGSDHEPFVYHENLPAGGAGFGGPFGTYHSAYDDPASLRVYDPGMHRAAAAARYTSLVVMRLAGAAAPDLRLGDVGVALQTRLAAFGKVDASPRRVAVMAALGPLMAAFAASAKAWDEKVDAAVAAGNDAAAQRAYGDERAAEARFFAAGGTSGSAWSRSLLYAVEGYGSLELPTLDATLDQQHGDDALHVLATALGAP